MLRDNLLTSNHLETSSSSRLAMPTTVFRLLLFQNKLESSANKMKGNASDDLIKPLI